MSLRIEITKTDAEVLATYAVMRQLHPDLPESEYLRAVRTLQDELGFQLASLMEDDCVVCAAGFRLCRSLGWGRYLYVDDLVTDESHRSKGAGKVMFEWLVDYARSHDCRELRLDSAVYRHEAHRFYLRERMDIVCFHFRLSL